MGRARRVASSPQPGEAGAGIAKPARSEHEGKVKPEVCFLDPAPTTCSADFNTSVPFVGVGTQVHSVERGFPNSDCVYVGMQIGCIYIVRPLCSGVWRCADGTEIWLLILVLWYSIGQGGLDRSSSISWVGMMVRLTPSCVSRV